MRTFKIILLLCVIFVDSWGQQDSIHDTPQKKDYVIGIYFTDEIDIALEKLGHSFAALDFKIDDVDPYKKTIFSSWGYPFANQNFRMKIVGSYIETEKEGKIITVISLVGFVEQYIYLNNIMQSTKTYYCEYKQNGTHVKNGGFRIMQQIADYNDVIVKYMFKEIPQ